MNRHSKRRRPLRALILVLCSALAVSAVGTWLVLRGGSQGRPAGPGPGTNAPGPAAPAPARTQAQADMSQMQVLLNSGSAARQAAILAPPLRFTPGSGPIVPSGKTIAIEQGTFRASGQSATVRARLSGGTAVTLDLAAAQGHWRLYGAQADARTSAAGTGQALTAQLMADTAWINRVPTKEQLGQRWPVIFIHGINGHGGDWGTFDSRGQPNDPSTMIYMVNQVVGTYVLSFGYDKADNKWVDDPLSGPAFARYINQVARVSKSAQGPGKVIIVAYSMGGLVTRYAAEAGAANQIAMVVTIGTPNRGSFLSDAFNLARLADGVYLGGIAEPFLAQQTAASGMSVFNSKISQLPALPPNISVVHAIAGDQQLVWRLLNATVNAPMDGDGVVPLWSALAKRPGGPRDTFDRVTNPLVPANWSAMHTELQKNPQAMRLVTGYVHDWIRDHPVPPPVQAQAPSGEVNQNWADYWDPGGAGTWYVHGMKLQFGQEGVGLGTFRWNAYAAVVTGEQHASFVLQADGSLVGTFTDDPAYHESSGQSVSNGWTPPPGGPQKGQTFTLVPDGPGHARYAGGASPWGGNPNLCQQGAPPDVIQACGA